MKRLPLAWQRATSFTLVEMLVAMAVFSIIVLTLAAMMSNVSSVWLSGINMTDNYSKAETMLSVMDRDVKMMVLRRDLAAFANQTNGQAFAFYTQVQGYPGADTRTLSLVQYSLVQTSTTTLLQRSNYGMSYQTNSTGMGTNTPAVGNATNLVQLTSPTMTAIAPDTLATGVVAFAWQFVDGTGAILSPPYLPTSTPQSSSSPPTGTTPFWFDFAVPNASYNPRVVVVSMAVVSNTGYTILQQNSVAMATLQTNFPTTGLPTTTIGGNTYPTETYAQYWSGLLNPATGTFGASLPAPVRGQGAIQIFERHIALPFTTPSN